MFEVAFTPKQRKNYLFYCLYHLFEDLDLNNYLEFLRKLADKYFFDVYLDTKSNPVSVASLKFRIMLQICQDNYDAGIKNKNIKRLFGLEWNVEDMVQHQEKMLEIIMNY